MSMLTTTALLTAMAEALPDIPIALSQALRTQEILASQGYEIMRSEVPATPDALPTGIELNASSCEIKYREQWVRVTQYEFTLLRMLLAKPGEFVSCEAMMYALHGRMQYGHSNETRFTVVRSHIKRIRRKFAQVDPRFAEIESRHGVGYRWRDRPSACPKCQHQTGISWDHCAGSCPIPGSPHFRKTPTKEGARP